MVEIKIKSNDGREIYTKYDETKYAVEYLKNDGLSGYILLKRLKDNKVIKVFKDSVGFIIEVDNDDITSFLVTSFRKGFDNNINSKLIHYTIKEEEESLKQIRAFAPTNINVEDVRLTDSSYIIGDARKSNNGFIYNLKDISERFDSISKDQNGVKVSEKLYSMDGSIGDTITYQINPETFEIIGKVKSDLEQREIDVYTIEDALRVNKDFYSIITRNKLEQMTKYYEIKKYLDLLSKGSDDYSDEKTKTM